jgi:hypothetical protein
LLTILAARSLSNKGRLVVITESHTDLLALRP